MAQAVTAEFVVNTLRSEWQNNPDVTTLRNGNVVVVWDSFTLDHDVQYGAAQIYRPNGTRIGTETILTDLGRIANHPRIEALPGGGFAMAWESSVGSVLNRTVIHTAVFNDNGQRISPIREVSQPLNDYYFAPEVVARADGGYSVIWSKRGPSPGETPFNGED